MHTRAEDRRHVISITDLPPSKQAPLAQTLAREIEHAYGSRDAPHDRRLPPVHSAQTRALRRARGRADSESSRRRSDHSNSDRTFAGDDPANESWRAAQLASRCAPEVAQFWHSRAWSVARPIEARMRSLPRGKRALGWRSTLLQRASAGGRPEIVSCQRPLPRRRKLPASSALVRFSSCGHVRRILERSLLCAPVNRLPISDGCRTRQWDAERGERGNSSMKQLLLIHRFPRRELKGTATFAPRRRHA